VDYYIRNNDNREKAKNKLKIDQIVKNIFLFLTLISTSVIIMIIVFISVRGSMPFLKSYNINGTLYRVDLLRFLSGTTWFTYPNNYQIGYIIINTLYVVFLALLIAIPSSVFTSMFIAKIAYKKIGKIVITINEMLASIPSIVYGVSRFISLAIDLILPSSINKSCLIVLPLEISSSRQFFNNSLLMSIPPLFYCVYKSNKYSNSTGTFPQGREIQLSCFQ
jgi:phosphate transport system permease protein